MSIVAIVHTGHALTRGKVTRLTARVIKPGFQPLRTQRTQRKHVSAKDTAPQALYDLHSSRSQRSLPAMCFFMSINSFLSEPYLL